MSLRPGEMRAWLKPRRNEGDVFVLLRHFIYGDPFKEHDKWEYLEGGQVRWHFETVIERDSVLVQEAEDGEG
jgi:hypothetical protein